MTAPFDYPDYPLRLQDINYGARFRMLNYETQDYVRVVPGDLCVSYLDGQTRRYADATHHLPVVGLSNGIVFGMYIAKPCRISDDRPETELEGMARRLAVQQQVMRLHREQQEELKAMLGANNRRRKADWRRIDNLIALLRRANKKAKE